MRNDETAAATINTELISIRSHIIGSVFTLLAIGIVLIYSASAIKAGNAGWELYFMANQAKWLIVGLAGMAIAGFIDYRWLQRLWPAILPVCLGLLAAVRIPGIGSNIRGSYRWFRFSGFNVQPSEIAKIGLVIVIAAILSRARARGFSFWKDFLPSAAIIGTAAGLIAIEPDFGTAALVTAVLTATLLVGGARWWHIGLMVLSVAPPAAFYGLTHFQHITKRVHAWYTGTTSGAGWQPFMSKVALGSGGTTGVGLGQGYAKLYYLPDAHTDFILAIAGQELGLLGTLFIVSLFGILVIAGMRLTRYARDRFGTLLAFGITMMIGLQAAFNIAVVTATIPPKGISLPFVSFGGSGLCVALFGVGLLVSISRRAAITESADNATQKSSRRFYTWRERVQRGDIKDLSPAAETTGEAA